MSELEFLSDVIWLPLFEAGAMAQPELPGYVLSHSYLCLGARSRLETRAESFSDVRLAAQQLDADVRAWTGLGRSAEPELVAFNTPSFLAAAFGAIPKSFRNVPFHDDWHVGRGS